MARLWSVLILVVMLPRASLRQGPHVVQEVVVTVSASLQVLAPLVERLRVNVTSPNIVVGVIASVPMMKVCWTEQPALVPSATLGSVLQIETCSAKRLGVGL